MELSMKVSGKTIFTTDVESFIMQAVTFMKENLWTIWLKALVYINMLTVANMLATGTKTNNMDLVKKSGMI